MIISRVLRGMCERMFAPLRRAKFRAGDLVLVVPKSLGARLWLGDRIALCMSSEFTWKNAWGFTRGVEVYFPDTCTSKWASFDLYVIRRVEA